MAGTDKTQNNTAESRAEAAKGPAIVLVAPQLGENIGAAARAMYNFGLTDLRLVAPRDGWPNPNAHAAASGASPVLERVRVFEDLQTAIGDLKITFATTARPREVNKPVQTPAEAALAIARGGPQIPAGFIFGGERAGLHNDDISLADQIIRIPVNPAFASLNLAQAVLLVTYEWSRQNASFDAPQPPPEAPQQPASRADIFRLFDHLETELDASGFLFPVEKRPSMVRNIRALLMRAALTDQDVRTLRGLIKSLVRAGESRAEDDAGDEG